MYDDAPWRALYRDLVERVERDVTAVLDGIDPLLLDASAEPGTNSIGWLVWHLTRSHDRNGSELLGAPQLWPPITAPRRPACCPSWTPAPT
jgi:hypothetical protein